MKSILSLIISAALVVSGYSQTRNVLVGTNNVVVQPTNFWSADASNARSGLGLGSAATNAVSAFQPASSVLTNLSASNGESLTNLSVLNIIGTLGLGQGGTGSTNASSARTALGLGTAATNSSSAFQPSSVVLSNLASSNAVNLTNLRVTNIVGWSAITNTNVATSLLGFTTNGQVVANTGTNALVFSNTLTLQSTRTLRILASADPDPDVTVYGLNGIVGWDGEINVNTRTLYSYLVDTNPDFGWGVTNISYRPIAFNNTTNSAATRTNLGLGWSALTNTNAGTGLVSVNTNGTVVSPTNFWQNAPSTIVSNGFQNFNLDIVNATNNATNVANLLAYSIASSVTGITNTINLPTNGSSGNIATIVHTGPTSSVTAIRQTNAGTNLITLNKTGESVRFVYNGTNWSVFSALSLTDPIYFSGTNAFANAAASRTNLGLGATNDVVFNSVQLGTSDPIVNVDSFGLFIESTNTNTGQAAINFVGDGATRMAANTRTNLGLGLPALTNTNVTNFLTAIGLGESNSPRFSTVIVGASDADDIIISAGGITTGSGGISFDPQQLLGGWAVSGAFSWTSNSFAATTRTNLGLGLPALTNTSNVTMMRALSGSTNTNHPYSGSISVTGTNNTNTLIFSNGILQSVTTP